MFKRCHPQVFENLYQSCNGCSRGYIPFGHLCSDLFWSFMAVCDWIHFDHWFIMEMLMLLPTILLSKTRVAEAIHPGALGKYGTSLSSMLHLTISLIKITVVTVDISLETNHKRSICQSCLRHILQQTPSEFLPSGTASHMHSQLLVCHFWTPFLFLLS